MPYIGREPQLGAFQKLDDLTSQFNSAQTVFTLKVANNTIVPGSPQNLIISVGGAIQEPGSAYLVNASTITFASAPANTQPFFGVLLGDVLDVGQVTPNTALYPSTVTASGDATFSANVTVLGTLQVGNSTITVNTSTLQVGNSTANTVATSTSFVVANSTNTATLTPISLTIGTQIANTIGFYAGANVYANTTTVFVGNSTANVSHTATQLAVANSTNTATLTPISLTIGTSVANTIGFYAGANVYANTTTVFLGNTTANTVATSTSFAVANSTNTATLTPISLTIGTTVVNTTAASFGGTVSVTGAANTSNTLGVAGTLSALGQLSVTGNATFDTNTLFVDATNNRVGIGTTSADYSLDITSGASAGSGINYPLRVSGGTMSTANDATGILFQQRHTNDDYGAFIRLFTTQTSPSFLNPQLEFGVQDTDTTVLASVTTKMTITGAGNVGIGVTSPETLLHVAKSTSGGEGGYLFIDNPAASALNNKSGIKFGTSSGASFASIPTGEITNICTNAGDGASALTFGTWNGSASGERMRLDASGNLGIGNIAPGTRLHVTNDLSTAYVSTNMLTSGTTFRVSNPNTSSSVATTILFEATGSGGGNGLGAISGLHTANGSLALAFGTRNNSSNVTERLRINSDGTIRANSTIGVGNANGSTSGAGITFPATQSASTNANTLDDYEEGTYTPTVVVASGTPTYTYQEGYYTKIGRQVFGGGIIGISNSNTLTGNIIVTVPFTPASTTYGYTMGTVSDGSGWTWPIGGYYTIYLQYNGSGMSFTGVGVSATVINYNSANVGASWYFRFQFNYPS